MRIAQNKRVLIAGKTQSGKSFFIKKAILPKLSAYIIYDIKREYGSFGVVVHSLGELKERLKDDCKKIVYQMSNISAQHFGEVSDFIYANLRNFVFVVDEIQNFVTRSAIPDGFKRLVCIGEGEPRRLGIIGATQRPANVHADFKGNVSVCVAFRFVSPLDTGALSHFFGEDSLKSLEKYHFLVWNESETPEVSFFRPLS